jgi:aryl-alcohol dehydrogenase-like predicted oxidoreductase
MANKLDSKVAAAARDEARRLEAEAESGQPYPPRTKVSRPNQPTRMFNVRLTEEQFRAIQQLAEQRHLPMSTMARAWLLDRLNAEHPGS